MDSSFDDDPSTPLLSSPLPFLSAVVAGNEGFFKIKKKLSSGFVTT